MKKIEKYIILALILIIFIGIINNEKCFCNRIIKIKETEEIKIEENNIFLKKGQRLKIKSQIEKKAIWFSDNKKIATVDSNGVIYGKKVGLTNIYAKTLKGTEKFNVMVYKPTAIFFGDSITYGTLGNPKGYSWANYIGDNYDLLTINTGINGITITNYKNKLTLPDNVQKHGDKKYDYIILHGGTNDVAYEIEIGKISDKTDFSGKYDLNTFSGSMEYYLYLVKKQWPNAKIGYIINYKTPQNDTYKGKIRYEKSEEYFKVQKKILNKWHIDYLDLYWGKNPNGESYSEIIEKYLPDKLHLNSEGYEVIAPYIYEFIESL